MSSSSQNVHPSVVFFDLDSTLYPFDPHSGVVQATKHRIFLYMRDKLHIEESRISELSQRYYEQYGLSLRGLMLEHNADPVDFQRFVDGGLDLESMIRPDPDLRPMIQGMNPSVQRYIFTNANRHHAARVLNILNVSDLFQGIIDVHDMEFRAKPDPDAYNTAMRIAGVSDPSKCLFLDDHETNVGAARRLGWHTVWVGHQGKPTESANHSIADVKDLPTVVPELFNQKID